MDTGFNYELAKSYGYDGFGDFLMGAILNEDKHVSWMGNKEIQWQILKDQLFEKPDNSCITSKITTLKKEVRMFPFSCYEFNNNGGRVRFMTNKPMTLYFTDPYRQPSFYLVKTALTKDPIKIGLNKYSGESAYYELDLTITEKRKDEKSCKVYEKPTDYEQCIDNNLHTTLKDLLGCIPPWMLIKHDDHVDSCDSKIKLENGTAKTIRAKISGTQIYYFSLGIKFL